MKKQLSFQLFLTALLVACTQPTSTPTPVIPPTQKATPSLEASPTIQPTETAVPTPEPSPTAVPNDTATILTDLGGYPCPDSEFTCVDVTVPLDHFSSQDARTIKTVFGVLPASGERKGVFVVANGGPGVSGLLSADDYVPYYDPAVLEIFDIVFFDQRGVGLSGGLQCPKAAADLYRADWEASTPAKEELLLDTAQSFAEACVEEMGNPEILPFLDTRQAVEDLEAFRQLIGAEKFWLYGESYGSQYAQTYAAAHPKSLAGLMLDGTVDLTLTGTDFLNGQARAFNQVLEETLQACNDDEACAEMVAGDAITAYDDLAVRLKQSPSQFDFPLPSGGIAQREFTFSDLETGAAGYLYSETARMIFLRALAAYARDTNLVPLARILYDSLVLDPETLEAIPDPSYSDAVYYGVECRDYSYFSGTVEESALAYLRAGDELDTGLPRFASVFYGDLPCAFWPNAQEDPARPTGLTMEGLPTLVLNATTDPATPYYNAQAVHSRLADGYLITETGGPHIIYAWGLSCVDDLVTAYLIDDRLPEQKETVCEGVVADEFVALAPLNASEFENPLEALASVDDEISYLPEYYYWDTETPTSIGCPFGGTLSFEPSDDGEAFTFDQCAFSEGFEMTGDGTYSYDDALFTLNVTVAGLASGTLTYTRDADWVQQVSGVYNGQEINLP